MKDLVIFLFIIALGLAIMGGLLTGYATGASSYSYSRCRPNSIGEYNPFYQFSCYVGHTLHREF